MKDCFGHVIKDSGKLEECRCCAEREACRSIQWGENASSVRVLPVGRPSPPAEPPA